MPDPRHPFLWLACLLAVTVPSGAVLAEQPAPVASPKLVVLFIIDGLAIDAPRRFGMKHWQALAEQGVVYKAMHLPLPAHPQNDPSYPWSCSLPNPMLMAGTPFVGQEGIRESMIQHRLADLTTAFVVNAYSYRDVAGGFDHYISRPHKPDALSVDEALDVLDEHQPRFMRLHLQRPGIEGQKVSRDRYADEPWAKNIWAEDSPYRLACVEADRQLQRFVDELRQRKLWDQTVLLICGDHGQADEGWHEPYADGSTTTPLLVVGHGVAGGRSFASCDLFDVAPTLAHLLGHPPPALSTGRVLGEAFDAEAKAPACADDVPRLNAALRQAHALPADQQALLRKRGFLTIEDVARWHRTEAGKDFGKFVMQQERILARIAPVK